MGKQARDIRAQGVAMTTCETVDIAGNPVTKDTYCYMKAGWSALSNYEKVKELLSDEVRFGDKIQKEISKRVTPGFIQTIFMDKVEGRIMLQFCGWSINLREDGTWSWDDTTGG